MYEFVFLTPSLTVDIINLLMFSNYLSNNVSLDGVIFKLFIIKDFTYTQN